MADDGTKIVFICGSALRGQPDHGNLQSATFMQAAKPLQAIDSMLLRMDGTQGSMQWILGGFLFRVSSIN